jgi:pimeloyl-ACP methyl ester carboxylesterase
VLTAHSLGGPIVRHFAGTYPQDTAGLVLVDTTTEFLQNELTPTQLPFLYKQLAASTQALKSEVPGVEEFDLATWFAQLRSMPAAPAVPVTVLSADIIDVSGIPKLVPDAPADYPEAYQRAQLAAERDLAASYAGAKLITKTDSGHNIPNIQPKLVTGAVRDVVEQVREGNH